MKEILRTLQKTKIALSNPIDKLQVGLAQTKLTTNTQQSLHLPSRHDADAPRQALIVLDVSGSMGSSDYSPTRLAGGVQAAIEYINMRVLFNQDDSIALITFNHAGKIAVQLTGLDDRATVIAKLKNLNAGGGTDIAEGLKKATDLFAEEETFEALRYIILLTDGHGGNPVRKAKQLKEKYGAVIEVVGVGGSPSAVNESLLRKVATTDPDPDGFNHYRFIKDTETLRQHYRHLARGLVWQGEKE